MRSLRLAAGAATASMTLLFAVGVAIAAPTASVVIDNFSYSPMVLTVAAGSTVTWTNRDDIPHTVRAIDGSFHSPPLDTDDHYSFTFAKPGVYNYFCSIHPKMVAKIIVKAG